MPRFYLDTSAILKKYLPEKGSDVVLEIYKDLSASASGAPLTTLLTSYIGIIESLGLAGRLRNAGRIRDRAYLMLVANMMRDFDSVDVWPVSERVLSRAVEFARDDGLGAADAIHAATVFGIPDLEANPVYFICSDRRLLAVVRSFPVESIDPEENGALEKVIKAKTIAQ